MDWLSRHDTSGLTAVAIAPDLGERYLDTVYQTNWIEAIYGKDVLRSEFDVPVQTVHQDVFSSGRYVMGSLAETITADPATGTAGHARRDAGRRDEGRAGAGR